MSPTREDLAFAYLDSLPFPPYPFQEEAILAWFESEQGVFVTAPTGMGKTLIAEAGLYEALNTGKRAYYTTPLIALTEQKYREVQDAAERWGFSREHVGLITGNRRENESAPVLVVVAEILFNRLLAKFDFADVTTIVIDEFHNFSDPERGIVWEFTLELLPPHIRTLLISATVGNAYDVVAWLRETKQRKLKLIQSTERKVPLTYRWVGDMLLTEQLEEMVAQDLTPALVFCFNRDECWNVADQIRGRDLVESATQKEIAAILDQHDWSHGAAPKLKQLLLRGVGIHHAGVLSKYRRIVERLFQQKLLSVCVCTETLAAGINLPARSVVMPTILKGKPGEMKVIESSSAHQIFGRAGRPQFDTHGFVIALAHEDDVKIARWREKYDQIPDDVKDPKLREAKKKLKKKMPTRRQTEQYWSEQQFTQLTQLPPARLASRNEIPWRFLVHTIKDATDITALRHLVATRLMGQERLKEGRERLEAMLNTLGDGRFVELDFRDVPVENPQPDELATVREIVAVRPLPRLDSLLSWRGVPPLVGLFLATELEDADTAERIQALEAVLEMPTTVARFVRVPNQKYMPPGKLATERLDAMLLEFGLASIEELVEKTDEEVEEEREDRRHFGGYAEERVFVLKFAEKLARLFLYRYPSETMQTVVPVWSAGELVLDFHGDFDKYITSRSLQKQEGIVFRHLLRLILLVAEFQAFGVWWSDVELFGDALISCCREIDPVSTSETLERAKQLAEEAKEHSTSEHEA
ncbi:MAG: DEAD/DEAH box helicase [Thermoguttaceae bacterium]